MFIWKEKLLKKLKYIKPNEISHRLISRTAEKEEDSEKKAEQNVETKLDSGKQEKKENAVERSGENIRTDSAEEALPYELVIVEAEKNKSIIKGKELWKMAVLSPFMVFTRLCLPRHHPVNHRLLFLTRFHQVNRVVSILSCPNRSASREMSLNRFKKLMA